MVALTLLALALCVLSILPMFVGWEVQAYAYQAPATQDMGLSWDMVDMELSIDAHEPCAVRVWVPRCHGRARCAVYHVRPKGVIITHPKRDSGKLRASTNYGLYGVLASGVPPPKWSRSLGNVTIPVDSDATVSPSPPG